MKMTEDEGNIDGGWEDSQKHKVDVEGAIKRIVKKTREREKVGEILCKN